jgi:glycosyltransferase involved in cell wall biosynthesis
LLRPAEADALARAVIELAASPEKRERMAAAAVEDAATRSWTAALEQLAMGYQRALGSCDRNQLAQAA